MNPKTAGVVQIAVVAVATVVVGAGFLASRDSGTPGVAAIVTAGLGVGIAALTTAFSHRETRQESLLDEEDRPTDEAMDHAQESYLATTQARDHLSLLDELLSSDHYQGRVEPPDIGLYALDVIKDSSRRLAHLGKVEEAERIDDHLRLILESHNSLAWLWFHSRRSTPVASPLGDYNVAFDLQDIDDGDPSGEVS